MKSCPQVNSLTQKPTCRLVKSPTTMGNSPNEFKRTPTVKILAISLHCQRHDQLVSWLFLSVTWHASEMSMKLTNSADNRLTNSDKGSGGVKLAVINEAKALDGQLCGSLVTCHHSSDDAQVHYLMTLALNSTQRSVPQLFFSECCSRCRFQLYDCIFICFME